MHYMLYIDIKFKEDCLTEPYLLRCKICGNTPYVGNFCLRFNIYTSKYRSFRKGKQHVPRRQFHSDYVQSGYVHSDCRKGIDD